VLSVEAQLLRHPFAVYEALARAEDRTPLRTVLARISLLLFVVAASVSFITAGRLTWRLLLGTAVAWTMVPAIECAIVLFTLALSHARISPSRAIGLYMAGNAPLLLFLVAGAAMCLFSLDVYAAFAFSLRTFTLPGLLLLAFGYGTTLSYAYYRSALGLSRLRSFVLLAVDVSLKTILVVGWYLLIDNIVPQLGWGRS